MAEAGHRTGSWRSLRDLPDRTPLRVKLIAAVLVLVAIALTVISLVGIYVLRAICSAALTTPSRSFTFRRNGASTAPASRLAADRL